MKKENPWTVAVLLAFAARCVCQDVFSEELLASWLSSSHLLVHLRFDQATTASRLHTSFPHGIQHLATTLPLQRVELFLTHGRWRYTDWGRPLAPAKPVGAVLEATFQSGLSAPALKAHWAALVNALSGLSCSSLGLLRDPSTVSGVGIRLQELLMDGNSNSSLAANTHAAAGPHLRAMLPHEPLCTENLTPWLRLLPCRDQAGLASLLRHRPTVFGSEYVSLGVLLEHRPTARGRPGVRLVQTITLVMRTAPHPPQPVANPDPGPDLEHYLSARVEHYCPAATRSEILVVEPRSSADSTTRSAFARACEVEGADGGCEPRGFCPAEAAATSPQRPEDSSVMLLPWAFPDSSRGTSASGISSAVPPLRRYDTLELLETRGGGLGLRLPTPPLPTQTATQKRNAAAHPGIGIGIGTVDGAVAGGDGDADVLVDRYTTGAGLLRGGFVLRIRRAARLRARLVSSRDAACRGVEDGDRSTGGGGADNDVGAMCAWSLMCVHQLLPWYVRPWLHTLAVLYDGQEVPLRQYVVAQRLRPAVQRASPGTMDICLEVPAAVAEVQLHQAFSKAFLTVFEYPPDAHRGFDIPAAVVSYPDPLYAPAVRWRTAGAADAESNGGVSDKGDGGEITSPLLASLSGGAVQQVYTPGLLIPLAAPDFSMPYNVICLSSTLLAVYFGTVLNLLTRRGRKTVVTSVAKTQGSRVKKVLQMALTVAIFAVLALYLDAELRDAVQEMMAAAGFTTGAKPKPGCGSRAC